MMKLEKFLVFSQTTVINIGVVLGFSTFYYSLKHKSFINSEWLLFYSKFMALVFLLAYPIGLSFYVFDENFVPISITDYARLCLAISNWIFCLIMYPTQASNSSSTCKIYNQVIALYFRYVSLYGSDDDYVKDLRISFMMKSVMRSFLLLFWLHSH